MKKIIAVLLIAVMLVPSIEGQAKTKVPEVTFEEQVTNMVQQHKAMTTQLIKMWEFVQKEIKLLAEVIYHENWHTDKERLAAYYTGAVVMNRVKSDKWPNTVEAVLYQKNPRQYSTTDKFFTTEIPEECYEMARDIYLHGTPDVPENVIYQATFKQGKGDWIPPINGEHFCFG